MEENKNFTSKLKSLVTSSAKNISTIFSKKKEESSELQNSTKKSTLETRCNQAEEESQKYKQIIEDYDTTISYLLNENENKELEILKEENAKLEKLNKALKADLENAIEKSHFYKTYARRKMEEAEKRRKIQENYFKEQVYFVNEKINDFKEFLRRDFDKKEARRFFFDLFDEKIQ